MAVKYIGGMPESFSLQGTVSAGVAIQEGDILDSSGNVLQRATSSSTIHTVKGYAAKSISATDTVIEWKPFLPGQIFEVDAQSNTATTQLYEGMVLQDHSKVNNTDSDVTGPTAVFEAWAIKGAAADKKLIGEFTRLPSTST